MIIGLTGKIAAGKGSAVSYFVKRGFRYITISDLIKQELVKRGMELVRENYQNLGDEVRRKEGSGAWIKRMNLSENENVVIDGIRNPGEVLELKKHKDFFLIAIEAPQETRYRRIVDRGKEGDKMSWDNFILMDNREIKQTDSSKMQLQECLDMADFKIENNSSIQDFNRKLEEVYGVLNKSTI